MNDVALKPKTAKDEVREALDLLPDELTLSELVYELGILSLIRGREANDDPKDDIPDEEMGSRIASWFAR